MLIIKTHTVSSFRLTVKIIIKIILWNHCITLNRWTDGQIHSFMSIVVSMLNIMMLLKNVFTSNVFVCIPTNCALILLFFLFSNILLQMYWSEQHIKWSTLFFKLMRRKRKSRIGYDIYNIKYFGKYWTLIMMRLCATIGKIFILHSKMMHRCCFYIEIVIIKHQTEIQN